jgi:hypothetical protein
MQQALLAQSLGAMPPPPPLLAQHGQRGASPAAAGAYRSPTPPQYAPVGAPPGMHPMVPGDYPGPPAGMPGGGHMGGARPGMAANGFAGGHGPTGHAYAAQQQQQQHPGGFPGAPPSGPGMSRQPSAQGALMLRTCSVIACIHWSALARLARGFQAAHCTNKQLALV